MPEGLNCILADSGRTIDLSLVLYSVFQWVFPFFIAFWLFTCVPFPRFYPSPAFSSCRPVSATRHFLPLCAETLTGTNEDERQSRCPPCGQGCVAPLDLLSTGALCFDLLSTGGTLLFAIGALCRMGKGEFCGDACPHLYGGYIPRAPSPQIPTGERFLSAYLRQYGTGKWHRATAAAVFSCKRHVREKSKSNDRGSKADCVGYGTVAIPSSPTRAGSAPQRRKRFHRVRLQRQT